MKIKEMSKDELEVISYDDLAYMILVETNKKFKITDLFKMVCDYKELSESVYENKIADFFELLSTDQRFYMLEDGTWDLKSKHTNKIKINTQEDDEDEEDTSLVDEDEEEQEEVEEDIFSELDETDDETEDDLKDLVVIDDEDEENIDSL